MAFLLRLRTIIHLSPSPSLLHHHHHHHHRLLSPSNSVSCLVNKIPFGILTLTNPSPSLSLLHHRRRLFSTSSSGAGGDDPNSNHSLLRELREAIKQLSVRECVFETPFFDGFSSLSPFNSNPTLSTIPFYPSSKQPVQHDSNPTSSTTTTFDDKLHQLKLKALSLRHKQDTDRQRLWEMENSLTAFSDKIDADEKLGNETDTLTLRLMWLKDRTIEFGELSVEMSNSRLASLYEIVQDLSKIKGDLQDNEVWNELNEGLTKVQEMELKDFELLSEKLHDQIASIIQRINEGRKSEVTRFPGMGC